MTERLEEMEKRDTYKICRFDVRSYECGPDGRIRPEALCDYMQEAASLNAADLGFSKTDFEPLNISWVMTRLRMVLSERPRWGESLEVLTFPRGLRRLLAWRDFVLTGSGGSVIARASSEWAAINLSTRKAVPIPPRVTECSNTVREPVLGESPFSKFSYPVDPAEEFAAQYRVRKADIDLNGHVNNVRYIEWMLESVPLELDGMCFPEELEVVFRSETMLGETVYARSAKAPGAPGTFVHSVAGEDGTEHITGRTVWRMPAGK